MNEPTAPLNGILSAEGRTIVERAVKDRYILITNIAGSLESAASAHPGKRVESLRTLVKFL